MASLLVNVGKEWTIDKLNETIQTTGDYIAWGTGAGTTTITDTELFTEASEGRVLASRSKVGINKIRWIGTLTANSPKTITNVGNFTSLVGGTLICKKDFTGIPLETGWMVEFTIELEIN